MRLASLLGFAVVLLLDVAGTVLLGTGGRPEHIVELLRRHFLLGEASIDLLGFAAVRDPNPNPNPNPNPSPNPNPNPNPDPNQVRGLLAPLLLLAGLRAAGLRKV